MFSLWARGRSIHLQAAERLAGAGKFVDERFCSSEKEMTGTAHLVHLVNVSRAGWPEAVCGLLDHGKSEGIAQLLKSQRDWRGATAAKASTDASGTQQGGIGNRG